MPRKSKKSIEEPVVEVSKKSTKRTIKIPSAIAENLRKVEASTNEVTNIEEIETKFDTVTVDNSVVANEEIPVEDTVEQEPEVHEVKKQKRTLRLNIGKPEAKTQKETPVTVTPAPTPVVEEEAFLDEPFMFSNLEISNKKVEKSENEPIVNLNSTFFYEPSVFEKYSIDVTETDSPDTVVNLNELIQNDDVDEIIEENDVEEIDEQEVEFETPSLNDIISLDDETESIEDILRTTEEYVEEVEDEIIEEEYEELVDEDPIEVEDEIIEEEFDEEYEEIVDEEPIEVEDEIIEEEYDEDYEELVDEEPIEVEDEIIEEEYDEEYEELVDEEPIEVEDEIIEEEYDEEYEELLDEEPIEVEDEIIEEEYDEEYEDLEESLYDEFDNDSPVTSNVINVNFDNNFVEESQDTYYTNIEEYDEDVIKESADNLEIPVSNEIPVGKLIEDKESASSPLFSKPKFDGISHIFKKFSYDETDNLNNEDTINNIVGIPNNLSDIHQVLGTFEAKDQKQVTEFDVVAEPVGISVPVIENDTLVETNLSGNYEQDNDSSVLNILSPETTNYEDIVEEYDEEYEDIIDEEPVEVDDEIIEEEYDEDYEEVDEYVEEPEQNVETVNQVAGIPVTDISALTKMFESFSETISTLSNRIAELEQKNSNPIVETVDSKVEDQIDDVEVVGEKTVESEDELGDVEINDEEPVEVENVIVDENIENETSDVEVVDEEPVEAEDIIVDENIEITDETNDVELVDEEPVEIENEAGDVEVVNEEPIEVEDTTLEDDPTSDFLKILDSLSQTISELENSSLDKETMENEFSTIDDIINNFTPNSEILEPIATEKDIVPVNDTVSIEDIVDKPLNNEIPVDDTENTVETNNLENVETTENIETPEPVEDAKLPEETVDVSEENHAKLFEVIDDGDYNDSSKFYKKYVPPTIADNKTLYISEETQKVYFPYTSQDVIEKLNDPLKGYSSIEEVINNEYTVPLAEFRKPIISRFKEAYNFMRTKEKGSISESFDLALELMFNSELDPAIIRATKDLNELDTYLDCLNADQLNKFHSFKIKYKKLKKHHK